VRSRSQAPARKLHGSLVALAVAAAVAAAACSDGSHAAGDGGADRVNARLDVALESSEASEARFDAAPADANDAAADVGGDSADMRIAPDLGPPPSDAGEAPAERPDADGDDMRTLAPDAGPADEPAPRPDAPADAPISDDGPADGAADDGSPAPDEASDVASGADAGGDGGPGPGVCAQGCPMNVQPQALLLWLSADVGVTCEGSSPPRVMQWQDRFHAANMIKPPIGKLGPECGGGAHVMGTTPVPFFDAPGTDADDGVLALDLRPMIASDYTVFVVERRLSGNEGYFLGTGITGTSTSCNYMLPNTSKAYHFGYFSTTNLLAGAYGYDATGFSCTDLNATIAAFSSTGAKAALDVERFSVQTGRALWIGMTSKRMNGDKQPIIQLPDGGYLGRAFQTLNPGTALQRGSRYVGDIAEVVIYTTALSEDDRIAVSTYLMNRWPVSP